MDLDDKIIVTSLENATIEQVVSLVREALSSGNSKKIINLFDCVAKSQLNGDRLAAVIDAAEDAFLVKDLHYLCRYLFLLYHKIGNEGMARYYLDQCATEIESNELYAKEVDKYALAPIQDFAGKNYYKNNFCKEYEFNGVKKSYFVYSFSDEIGQNMTLLKTPYGGIIFDCGAKCSSGAAITITTEELRWFLKATETSKDDIRAIIISHAHLDHYGSLATLINYGFDLSTIFMSEKTKALINVASSSMIDLDRVRPVSEFFTANNNICITPFVNGHIVGSEGYLVTFDEQNVFYTGDFCLHDQLTVRGLNPELIKNIPAVRKHGIDCLITESTYGNKQHYLKHKYAESVLTYFVGKLIKLGYNVFLPSFAIGRSQEIALMLNKNYSVLVDGMAIEISREYEKLTGLNIYNDNTRYNTHDGDERLYNLDCNNVIIASSGMIVKGSAADKYLSNFLNGDRRIAIIKTGFISGESYGNDLIDRWKGQNNILLDVSLSAHAGYDEIVELIDKLQPRNIVAIHGDGIEHLDSSSKRQEQSDNTVRVGAYAGVSANGNESMPDGTADTVSEGAEEDLGEIVIAERQITSKMDNVVKTGKRLKESFISLQKSQTFISACRILVKFLKDKEKYESILQYLNSLLICNVEQFYEYVCECVNNNYTCRVKKAYDVSVVKSVDEREEENLRQREAQSIIKLDGVGSVVNFEAPFYSDIMIVKMSEDDYYVSEKIHGREPYYRLLVERSERAIHYEQYEEALAEAKRLQALSIQKSPNCQIVDIDFSDYPNEGFRSKNPQVQSDIMIVKMEEGNYYVNEKIHGREPYYKLLMERSYTSTHFHRYEEARIEAERLRDRIIAENPDCEIVDIDILNYPRNAKIAQSDNNKIVYDEDGNIVFGVTEKGRLVFEYRPDEKEYELIDKNKYHSALENLYNDNNSDELDFYAMGVQRAYGLAKDSSIPYIRYEIYKAEEMLKSFDSDTELFSCDIEHYNGYIKGLNDAIELQKKCKLATRHWLIHLVDLYYGNQLDINGYRGVMLAGDYEIVAHADNYGFADRHNDNEAFIILTDQKRSKFETMIELGLQYDQLVAFCKCSSKNKFSTRVLCLQMEHAFEKLFKLDEGDPALSIQEDWVESLAQLGIQALSEKSENTVSTVTKRDNGDIPPTLRAEYVRVVKLLLNEDKLVTSSDIGTLKGMSKKCIKKNGPDWLATYRLLGEPDIPLLRKFKSDAKKVKTLLKDGNRDGVSLFRDKYKGLLTTLLGNLIASQE